MTTNDATKTQVLNRPTDQTPTSDFPGFSAGSSAQTQVLEPTRLGRVATSGLTRRFASVEPTNIIIAADCSSSVHGSMDSINAGLAGIKSSICKDPVSGQTAHVSVISFNSEVKVWRLRDQDSSQGLDEVDAAFVPAAEMPEVVLRAKGATHLNDAILKAVELEREQVHRQVRLHGQNPRRSLLIILSDGADYPGKNIDAAAAALSTAVAKGKIKVMFLGFGDYKPEIAERLAGSDGWFAADDGASIDDFLELAGKYARVLSSEEPGKVPAVGTKVGTPDSPIRFCSPAGMTLREYLAS